MAPSREEIHTKVREWIGYAAADLFAAEHLAGLAGIAPWLVAFHSQQAVEKVLKAFLVFHNVDFPLTHNIALLRVLCKEFGDWTDPVREAEGFTHFATVAKYPSVGKDATPAEAAAALTVAIRIVALVKSILASEGLQLAPPLQDGEAAQP